MIQVHRMCDQNHLINKTVVLIRALSLREVGLGQSFLLHRLSASTGARLRAHSAQGRCLSGSVITCRHIRRTQTCQLHSTPSARASGIQTFKHTAKVCISEVVDVFIINPSVDL